MTSKTYTYTADELRNKKSAAFLSAYSGHTVKITNVRFPGGHFELKFVRPAHVENDEKREKINPPREEESK